MSASSSSSGLAAAATAAKAEAVAEKESFRGIWIPCALNEESLKNMEKEGLLATGDWRSGFKETVPNPHAGERVHFGTYLDRGLSFPPSEFFSEVIDDDPQV